MDLNHVVMRIFFFFILTIHLAAQNYYPYQAIPFNKVKIQDSFWLPKIEVNRVRTIPWSFYQSKITGRIKNFEQAAARSGKLCGKYVFDDSDIYKIIEGASYSLQVKYDKALDLYIDTLIDIISKAQEPDGYLYTARTMGDNHKWLGSARYEREHEHSHELYNMGHFYEAATAHYYATGKKNMLQLAIKNADHLLTVFGPGKKAVAPGHQVIEIGLVKMYLATGNKKYLDLSQFFIECRGQRAYPKKPGEEGATVWETGEYWQDHVPAIKQTEAIGHAVRATYLYSGMADVAALTQNKEYIAAIKTIWDNAAGKKTYITGGLGAAGDWEGFGPDYELPNESAYCETCAGIGNVYWNHRMFMLTGQSKYIDMLERTLYNGILGGIGLDGESFYYANPMEYALRQDQLSGENKRSPWFTCSCCPSNVCRFMPSIPGYMYAQQAKSVYINLYASSETSFTMPDGKTLQIKLVTNYPWSGAIQIKLTTPGTASGIEAAFQLRIPGWCGDQLFPTDLYASNNPPRIQDVQLAINKQVIPYSIDPSGYIKINRLWKSGDEILLTLPMQVQTIKSHEKIVTNRNLMAVQKGPLLYCAEFADNNQRTSNLILPLHSQFVKSIHPDLLGGIDMLQSTGNRLVLGEDGMSAKTEKTEIKLIPYFARSNRGVGEMQVWFPTKINNLIIEH